MFTFSSAGVSSKVNSDSRQEMDIVEKMRKLVDENPGKSISVFLNPEDGSTPHFRIDGKFY